MLGENEGQLRPKSSLDLKDVRTGLQLMKDMAQLPWWCPGYKLKLSEISFKLDLDLDCKFINFVNLHSNFGNFYPILTYFGALVKELSI